MRAFHLALFFAGALGLAAFFPRQAAAGPYGYYNGRYYPSPGATTSYPTSPNTFAFRSFNYYSPVYPMFPNTYAPTVNSSYYSAPVGYSYNYQAARPYYYSAPAPAYYYGQPGTYLYANSYP